MTISASHNSHVEEQTDSPIHFKIHNREVSTDIELREVVHCTFGDWPEPEIDNSKALSISEYLASSTSPARENALSAARQQLATSFDGPLTLRELRLAKGFSQKELAGLLGTSQSQVARLEANKQHPILPTLKKLGEVLEVDLNQLGEAFDG